jgi:hypothetical protein
MVPATWVPDIGEVSFSVVLATETVTEDFASTAPKRL